MCWVACACFLQFVLLCVLFVICLFYCCRLLFVFDGYLVVLLCRVLCVFVCGLFGLGLLCVPCLAFFVFCGCVCACCVGASFLCVMCLSSRCCVLLFCLLL